MMKSHLTLNDMQKAMGAQSFLSTKSILGTWTSRISKGPDADWILCTAYTVKPKQGYIVEAGMRWIND